jgi:hypothetical protein
VIRQRVSEPHKYCLYSLRDPVTGFPATAFASNARETTALADEGSKDVDHQATTAAATFTVKGFGGASRLGELSKYVMPTKAFKTK